MVLLHANRVGGVECIAHKPAWSNNWKVRRVYGAESSAAKGRYRGRRGGLLTMDKKMLLSLADCAPKIQSSREELVLRRGK